MATKESDITINGDFIQYCMKAMSWLKKNKRSNVIYNFAKGIGTMREDKSDSLLPVKRMPMGINEHTSNFFISMVATLMHAIHHYNYVATFLQRKPCPEDYRLWLESMYSLFGTKFVKFFNGPMWKLNHPM